MNRRSRTLAQIALACFAAALAVLLVAIVFFRGLTMVVAVVSAVLFTGAGTWWFIAHRGLARWLGAAVAAATPVVLVILSVTAGFWLAAIGVAALATAGLLTAGAAARDLNRLHESPRPRSRTRRPSPPRRPVLIMNPASGGGKVAEYDLVAKAEALGARVLLLDPGTDQDVAQMARDAVVDGADLLGVAGGDGTQALVAAVAAEHGLPFLVLSAGTRNHFAMDLGLDRADPAAGLAALRDGVELRVDLGMAGDRPFVNTASFGAYAEIVQNPQYRDSKAVTALAHLPDLVASDETALAVEADGDPLPAPQVLLVSNNPYLQSGTLGGGRRPRLDRGVLGVVAVHVGGALRAAELALLGAGSGAVTVRDARQVRINADQAKIPVAVDGEALDLQVPVVCTIHPGALRVRVPRHRTAPSQRRPLRAEWRTVLGLALGRFGTGLHQGVDQ